MKKTKLIITLSSAAIVISLSTIVLQIFVFANKKPSYEQQYRQMIRQELHSFSIPLPDSLTFCSEKVPLDNTFVREALDRELTSLTYQHANTIIILKRAFRYFPQIEKILQQEGMPEDLKFLAVAESSLNNVVSPAKAEGFWQFMAATARQYGLIVNQEYDQRYDVEKSTRAACKYLRGAYSRLGSWSIACASYNCGEKGVRDRMNEQGVNNYWHLALNSETARYVYRILAYKIIMSSPKDYGFYIRRQDCYLPFDYDTIKIDSSINDFYAFSKQIGVDYKYFRYANPELKAKKLTNKENKEYILKIPSKQAYSWHALVDKLQEPEEFIDKEYE